MGENADEVVVERGVGELQEKVDRLEAERKLVMKLAEAGARDIETAVLVGMARLTRGDGLDVDAVIEEMRKEKAYLFSDGDEKQPRQLPRRTDGAKQRRECATDALQRAAKKAATSGSRQDLQEYLRLRRTRR